MNIIDILMAKVLSGGSGGGGGGSGGALVVNTTVSEGMATCDKTAAEMFDACQNGTVLIRLGQQGTGQYVYAITVICAMQAGSEYTFVCYVGSSSLLFVAEDGESYPQVRA